MAKRKEKDLFGMRVIARRPRYESSLSRAESRTLPVRAARIRWLATKLPRGYTYMMPSETFYVFDEAKSSYVYGCFVATTVLCAAFVDHWVGGQLAGLGFVKEGRGGLAAIVECCKKHDLLNSAVLNRIERLRLIRNPFVHLKESQHPYNIGQRTFRERSHPLTVMEEDAKEALITMYAVATSNLMRPTSRPAG